ncbi:hypothetical protein [Cohnella sp. GCM10012308]|uniref:hypothetical protein n=1 Tax=Cohnella sp. GCM10012308 TaxID=3317329 RepID=UPI00361B3422
MLDKVAYFAVIAIAIVLADLAQLRHVRSREKAAYGSMLAIAIYLGVIYVAQSLAWPNLDNLFDLLKGPAGRLVHFMS